jgi:hypothetical protein
MPAAVHGYWQQGIKLDESRYNRQLQDFPSL